MSVVSRPIPRLSSGDFQSFADFQRGLAGETRSRPSTRKVRDVLWQPPVRTTQQLQSLIIQHILGKTNQPFEKCRSIDITDRFYQDHGFDRCSIDEPIRDDGFCNLSSAIFHGDEWGLLDHVPEIKWDGTDFSRRTVTIGDLYDSLVRSLKLQD